MDAGKRKEANTSGRQNSSNVQNEMRIDLGQVVVFGADPIRSKPVEGCSTGGMSANESLFAFKSKRISTMVFY